MSFKDTPIRRKLMRILLVTSGAVLLLTCASFFAYEFLTFRQTTVQELSTLSEVVAANSTASLAFENKEDAQEVLSALKAKRHIVAAGLYDKDGRLFAKYPGDLPDDAIPAAPEKDGYRFGRSHLAVFQPVVQGGNKRLGTLYLKSGMGAMYERFRLYGVIALLVIAGSFLLAYALSRRLQQQISHPILALAETAKAISDRSDYSVRAPKLGQDELGLLTDAFNQMLAQIHEQNQALSESEGRLRAVLNSALSAVLVIDASGGIVDWNDRAEKIFGWSRGEVMGRELAETIIPPRYREAHRRGLKHFLASGEGPVLNRLIELSALRRDGSEFPVELSINALKTGEAVTFCGFISDITERKRAEQDRVRMAAIVESSEDAIISKTVDGKITSWNPGAEKLFGYTAAEAIGQPMTMLFPPERQNEEGEILASIARGASLDHFETVRVRKDGTPIEVSVTISPIRDQLGKVIGASKIARDTTERNRALRSVRKSEAQLRLIWETALDGMRLLDQDGIFRMVNDAYCRFVEKPREELEGKPLSVVFEPHRQEEVMRLHRERFQTRNIPPHYEREVTLWNGRRMSVELTNSFLDVEGQAPLLFSTFRDITERQRAARQEAAFGRLGQSLSGAVSASAAAHVIAATADDLIGWDACSLGAYEADPDLIFPVISIDTVDGKRVDVPPAYVGQPPSPLVRRVLEQGSQLILREAPFAFSSETVPFGNKSRPSASLMYVPIRSGEKVIGVLSIQSYTPGDYDAKALGLLQSLADQCGVALERVRAEENLRKLNEELERRVHDRTAQLKAANQELEAFTYSVSHDLRAPLRHIAGFVGLLEKSAGPNLPGQSRHHLDTISDSAKRMGRLIDDLLDFSRTSRAEIRRATVDVQQLLEETIGAFQSETLGRNVVWKKEPLPPVEADPALLRQVFVNLLSNAVKYTRPRDPAEIQIGCAAETPAEVVMFVRDNGVGFDMEYADKLFGVFQRLHADEDFEGTGIGLANVRRIIARHGGRTWAEGRLDAGATFYFSLPKSNHNRPLP